LDPDSLYDERSEEEMVKEEPEVCEDNKEFNFIKKEESFDLVDPDPVQITALKGTKKKKRKKEDIDDSDLEKPFVKKRKRTEGQIINNLLSNPSLMKEKFVTDPANPSIIECNVCHAKFNLEKMRDGRGSHRLLANHVTSRHAEMPIWKHFTGDQHGISEDGNVKWEKFQCLICGQTNFGDQKNIKMNLSYHLKNKHNIASFKCLTDEHKQKKMSENKTIDPETGEVRPTGKANTKKGGVWEYMEIFPEDNKKVKCIICNEIIILKPANGPLRQLLPHIRTHNIRLADLPCSICGKSFDSPILRNIHEKGHSQAHKCPQCGKGFKNRHKLADHTRTHTGEKPYKCQVCGVAYAQKATLTNHMKKH